MSETDALITALVSGAHALNELLERSSTATSFDDEGWRIAMQQQDVIELLFEQLVQHAKVAVLTEEDKKRLVHYEKLHNRNLELIRAAQKNVESARSELDAMKQVEGYAPLDPRAPKAPRYIDKSA